MSQENVEIVRRTLASFDVGGDVDVGYALLDPAVVVDASRNIFNPATYMGIDGVRAWRAEIDEDWGACAWNRSNSSTAVIASW